MLIFSECEDVNKQKIETKLLLSDKTSSFTDKANTSYKIFGFTT